MTQRQWWAARSFAACVFAALAGCGKLPPPGAADADERSAAATSSAKADAEQGRLLLARYQCGSCHTIPGVPASTATMAASLESFGRRSYIAGRVANDPALLAQWIADPASIVPGTPMPNMGASIDDARAMAAYLGQLK